MRPRFGRSSDSAFTIGFAQLVWWKALLAVILWPYFLGVTLR